MFLNFCEANAARLKAAVNATILRDGQVRFLAGEPLDPAISEHVALLTTLENTFNRTAAELATERVPKDVTSLGRSSPTTRRIAAMSDDRRS